MAFGRRHRRIAWTAGILFTAAAIGGLFAWKQYRESRPDEYMPGEESAEITHAVEEHGERVASGAGVAPARFEKRERRSDPLNDPGRSLPAGAPPPRFTDVTAEAGLGSFRTFAGSRTSQLPEDMGGGAAWGDFDNDGFDDLFLTSAGGALTLPSGQRAPSMLFHNRGDGTFEQVRGFPELRILGMGAAWADYDNDGWLDLVVTGYDTLLLFHNQRGSFVRERRFPEPKGFWTGASWGDYNGDGYPDLYVCGYVRYTADPRKAALVSQQYGLDVPYTLNPASFEAERNLLFRNNANGTFTEMAHQLGVDNPEGRSLSALWRDFDGDGRLDLYVANDISENKLYLNRHGRFEEAGHAAWIAEYRGSMGLAAGDFDRDGDDDLFISHWIAQQDALYQSLLADNLKAGRPAELRFTDVAEMVGIGPPTLQKIGWGTAFADFDSDGWPDLAVANGSTFETKDGSKRLVPMESILFWSDRGRFFHNLAPWNRSLSQPHVSRGLAVSDFDNDGAMDILIVDLDGGVRLLRNDMPHGNWVQFRLRNGTGQGDDATVTAYAGDAVLRTAITSASYLSQDTRRVHFGLGAREKVDRLEIRWPDGRQETWTGIEANRIWEVAKGDPAVKPFTSRGQTVEFWAKQRAAMDAIRTQRDFARAARLFREALAIDPSHEDSLYYLANCLEAMGDRAGALAELDRLVLLNPRSLRGWQRRGVLLAAGGRLDLAEQSVQKALRLNPEETGSLLLLGEIALARGDLQSGEEHLRLACRTNPRAVGGLFLRAYIAWKRRVPSEAAALLDAARKARGPDWKPKNTAAEGDVKRRMDEEAGFLARFWEDWDGTTDPGGVFGRIDSFLRKSEGP